VQVGRRSPNLPQKEIVNFDREDQVDPIIPLFSHQFANTRQTRKCVLKRQGQSIKVAFAFLPILPINDMAVADINSQRG